MLQNASAAERVYRAFVISWIEYRVKYERTALGVFWPIVSISVFVLTLGILFSQVMNKDVAVFMPHVAWGYAIWTFISGVLQSASVLYTNQKGFFISGQNDLMDLSLRIIFRNFIEFLFQSVPAIFVTIVLYQYIDISVLLVIPVVLLTIIHAAWVMIFFSILCARFVDMGQIIPIILRVGFLATPIIWMVDSDRGQAVGWFMFFNPFYHILEPLRDAFLSKTPSMLSLSVSVALATVGCMCAVVLYRRFHRQAVLWG